MWWKWLKVSHTSGRHVVSWLWKQKKWGWDPNKKYWPPFRKVIVLQISKEKHSNIHFYIIGFKLEKQLVEMWESLVILVIHDPVPIFSTRCFILLVKKKTTKILWASFHDPDIISHGFWIDGIKFLLEKPSGPYRCLGMFFSIVSIHLTSFLKNCFQQMKINLKVLKMGNAILNKGEISQTKPNPFNNMEFNL